jgi:hypothetical protein
MTHRRYIKQQDILIPQISGAKGGKGGGGGSTFSEDPNSLFSTDVLFITAALGEGPVYRINPNGPQDIEINDSAIDDLINLDGDGQENSDLFKTLARTGTTTQTPLPVFGETTITPQSLASPVTLKKGNVAGIPESKISLQDTSNNDWDSIKFAFIINGLYKQSDQGKYVAHTIDIKIEIFDNLGVTSIKTVNKTITGKTNTAFRFTIKVDIPDEYKSADGYKFTITKTNDENDDSRFTSNIQFVGWEEVKNDPQAYPRTAHIGYAIKAANEHNSGIPTFTSLVKGLLIKVPSNYNQPILENGEIDWRELEVADSGDNGYPTKGYRQQFSGTGTVLTASNPEIYVGTWDGSFVYSWSQNPVWIIYDILTNKTYGLGINEENIDKYKFYQIAQYCDACDSETGQYQGVESISDGSFRHKPRGTFTAIRETLRGLAQGTSIKQRRFILDVTISDQQPAMDLLNSLCSTFRGVLVYSFGKISLAVDMPDQYPLMVFNETNIKKSSFQISGGKESDILTGVDVSYIEPSNHFKREIVRVDGEFSNDGVDRSVIENIAELDLPGVTRRSQALRFAQYQIAASKYLRRVVSFTTSTDALSLAPGDLISVSQNLTGVDYGYGGKIANNSAVSGDSNVTLEHFTFPALSASVFTANTYPVALRVVKLDSDRIDMYILSNTSYDFIGTDNVSVGSDLVTVKAIQRYNPITQSLDSITSFDSNNAPSTNDLWSLGEWENPGNFYTSKAGRLFKVTEISRDSNDEDINIVAAEYVSNIYVDSDTFIDYTPTAYTDMESSLTAPPPPAFDFTAQPFRRVDGTVGVNGVIENRTQKLNYNQNFTTEYFISTPETSTAINNVTLSSPLTFIADNATALTASETTATLFGKNGFTGTAGEIRLLCSSFEANADGNVDFYISGLSNVTDPNFNKFFLDVNDGSILFKGTDHISVPVKEKTAENSQRNFVGYAPEVVNLSQPIQNVNTTSNRVKITNITTNGTPLSSVIPDAPFYVTFQQLLDARYYNNNSFYVSGSDFVYSEVGSLADHNGIIDLKIKPRSKNFIRFYVDGVQKSSGQYTYNQNQNLGIDANISYTTGSDEITYRIEVDHYTVPVIEVGDNIQLSSGNVFSVINTSYTPSSADYDAALTANNAYRIQVATTPTANVGGFDIVNITPNPIGTIANVSGSSFTFDYNTSTYPGAFDLANNRVYNLFTSSVFEKLFLTESRLVPDLPLGVTTVRARNKNRTGRISPTTERFLKVEQIPIQKPTDLAVTESLYREQTGGVAVRATCTFTAITGQEITDYEISYKLENVDGVGSDDGGTDLLSFNTVKVPAAGVDDDGKVRFTVNGINRGTASETNSITFRVRALNNDVRGAFATVTKTIIGKSAKPQNVFDLTGGQQSDQITLFWQYARLNDELADLDLKEVVIRRIQGEVSATLDNFIAGVPFVTVAAGVNRKSIPIDVFGQFTYLARTRDTSGNLSDDVVATTITTTRPITTKVVAAYSEDSPSVDFTDLTNRNFDEENFPSFANSNTGGLSYPSMPSSLVDNANGTSTGFSAAVNPTDLLATEEATYITQIRDFGTVVNGSIFIDIDAVQEVQTTFLNQHEHIVESTTQAASSGQLKDSTIGPGLGSLVGYANTMFGTATVNTNLATAVAPNFRYDGTQNFTLRSGGTAGNVYAIHLHGNFVGDTANANVIAYIQDYIDADTIVLGNVHNNVGDVFTGSALTTVLANIATAGTAYALVDLKQFSDAGATETFQGDLGAISTQTFIRTSSYDNTIVYHSNGNVNTSAFVSGSVNEGFLPYEAGSRSFRQFQIKFIINNSQPDEFDFTIDKFQYTVEKDKSTFDEQVYYNASPKTVDISAGNFARTPTVVITPIGVTSSQTAVITSRSTSSVSFTLFDNDAGVAVPLASNVECDFTATGV